MIGHLEDRVDMLDRHMQVLQLVVAHEPIGIMRLSDASGYPKHKVRYSLRILEEEGLIEPTATGAITTDQTSEFVTEIDERLDAATELLDTLPVERTNESQQTSENDESPPVLSN